MISVTARSFMLWRKKIFRRNRRPLQRGDRLSTSFSSVFQASLLMTCTLSSANCCASLHGVSAFSLLSAPHEEQLWKRRPCKKA